MEEEDEDEEDEDDEEVKPNKLAPKMIDKKKPSATPPKSMRFEDDYESDEVTFLFLSFFYLFFSCELDRSLLDFVDNCSLFKVHK